jgi:diaminohydroxyphosphoribosylaminopyrimidine deaminase/5-amino-6-(5-phosphoribosylamino)uracil reductase
MSVAPAPAGSDERFMLRALELARAVLGKTAPNPSVGCVIVREGQTIGEGATGAGGRPHAEEVALGAAGKSARGATAYVTLEPCGARSSGAPSCSQLLAEAGVARVVIACEDPHPVGAHGAEGLREAGIDLVLGVLRGEAQALNCGFFKVLRTGRPWLAIDGDASSYDAEFWLQPDETCEGALDRMGKAGLTRVLVRPGVPLATQLKARGLVDEDRSAQRRK